MKYLVLIALFALSNLDLFSQDTIQINFTKVEPKSGNYFMYLGWKQKVFRSEEEVKKVNSQFTNSSQHITSPNYIQIDFNINDLIVDRIDYPRCDSHAVRLVKIPSQKKYVLLLENINCPFSYHAGELSVILVTQKLEEGYDYESKVAKWTIKRYMKGSVDNYVNSQEAIKSNNVKEIIWHREFMMDTVNKKNKRMELIKKEFYDSYGRIESEHIFNYHGRGTAGVINYFYNDTTTSSIVKIETSQENGGDSIVVQTRNGKTVYLERVNYSNIFGSQEYLLEYKKNGLINRAILSIKGINVIQSYVPEYTYFKGKRKKK